MFTMSNFMDSYGDRIISFSVRRRVVVSKSNRFLFTDSRMSVVRVVHFDVICREVLRVEEARVLIVSVFLVNTFDSDMSVHFDWISVFVSLMIPMIPTVLLYCDKETRISVK